MLSSAQEHIDTICGFEESNFLFSVASDQGDDGDLGLFALEIINRGDTEKIAQLLLLQGFSFVILPCISLHL